MDHFPNTLDPDAAAAKARELIAGELARQTEKHNHTTAGYARGQLTQAALAHLHAVDNVMHNTLDFSRQTVFDLAMACYYPADWSGFRDCGSDIANLVVAAAYIQNEIKRRIMLCELSTRALQQDAASADVPLPQEEATHEHA